MRRALVALLLAGMAAGCGKNGYDRTTGYDSEASRNIETVANYQLEAIEDEGVHLGYEDTMRVAKPHDIEIVAGASRAPSTVSAQLQNAARGVVPLAAPDGDDCSMLIIKYPAEGSGHTEVTLTWVLIEDYVRNTEAIASAVCSAESYSSLPWADLPAAPERGAPIVFTH
jgi:hypothetical protein